MDNQQNSQKKGAKEYTYQSFQLSTKKLQDFQDGDIVHTGKYSIYIKPNAVKVVDEKKKDVCKKEEIPPFIQHFLHPTAPKHVVHKQPSVDIERLKQEIQILDYAKDHGYTPVRVGRYYELKEHGSMRIDPQRNLFFHNASKTSGSVLDFAMFVADTKDVKTGIQLLSDYAGNDGRSISVAPNPHIPVNKTPKIFELPKRLDTKFSRLYAYLSKSRCIDVQVITDMVRSKVLYEDEHHNCVFAGYDKENRPRYAGLRTTITEGHFKGEAEGSNKDIGWSVNNKSSRVFVTEAPIDVMSLMTILKLNKVDYNKFNFVSLGGIAPNTLLHHLKENPQIKTIYLGLDNDKAGISGTEAIQDCLKEIGYKGQVIIKTPQYGKDWNLDVQHIVKEKQQEKKYSMEQEYEIAMQH